MLINFWLAVYAENAEIKANLPILIKFKPKIQCRELVRDVKYIIVLAFTLGFVILK